MDTDLELALLKQRLRKACILLIADWLLDRDKTLTDEEFISYVQQIRKSLSPIHLKD